MVFKSTSSPERPSLLTTTEPYDDYGPSTFYPDLVGATRFCFIRVPKLRSKVGGQAPHEEGRAAGAH